MLLQIRDTLYEGSWEDFVTDLRARAEGRPHVFETVPVSASLKATIAHHLELISAMQAREHDLGRGLRGVRCRGRGNGRPGPVLRPRQEGRRARDEAGGDKGEGPADKAITPDDVAATFYRALGIDPAKEYHTPSGRPVMIVREGKPIAELV
jgi:hypothetical protein